MWRVRLKPTKTRKLQVKLLALPLIHLVLFSYCSVPRPFLSPNAKSNRTKKTACSNHRWHSLLPMSCLSPKIPIQAHLVSYFRSLAGNKCFSTAWLEVQMCPFLVVTGTFSGQHLQHKGLQQQDKPATFHYHVQRTIKCEWYLYFQDERSQAAEGKK